MARSAQYVADYQRQLSSIVAEERYEQVAETKDSGGFSPFGGPRRSRTMRVTRRLASDYLLVNARGQSGWIPFRDVFEVDGKTVRDREERLTRLFLDSPTTAWEQAAAIAEESSRYNIGGVIRTVNVPTLALLFVAEENQPRFEFRHEKTLQTPSGETWEISYRESQRPTLIRGPDGAGLPAFGALWVDARDGRVVQSRFQTEAKDLVSQIDVMYQHDDQLGLVVPGKMTESYRTSAGETIEGVATYGRFRQFTVDTYERIR